MNLVLEHIIRKIGYLLVLFIYIFYRSLDKTNKINLKLINNNEECYYYTSY